MHIKDLLEAAVTADHIGEVVDDRETILQNWLGTCCPPQLDLVVGGCEVTLADGKANSIANSL